MSLTYPRLAYPVSIVSGTGPHITITYVTNPAENVSIAAGTYYAQGDNGATCLYQAVEDALNTNGQGITFSVTPTTTPHGETLITATGGSDVIAEIEFTTSQLYAMDLGFALTTSTTVVTFALGPPNLVLSTYRIPSAWYPTAYDYLDMGTKRDAAVGAFTDSGAGVVDIYAGHTRWKHMLFEVYGALIREQYVADSAHAGNVSGLEVGDTNAPLDMWLRRLHDLLGGSIPTLRWTPDISTPSTYRNVRITNALLYESVEEWIQDTNEAPLWHDLAFELSEVPS